MGMSMILSIIMGIAMTAIIGSQVAPSMIEKVKATKVEAKAINNQEVIFEAVKRYITMKQTNPTDLEDVISKGFLHQSIKDNGFGGGYEIDIDGSKGLLKVKTTIDDPKAQEIFLNSFKNKFIPTRVVGKTNEFETTFVIPTDIMHGRGLFMTGIPVQATKPTDTSLKYWYDTSGKEVALRMYDPTSDTWKKVAGTSGSGSISEGALVDTSGNNFTKDTLPTTDAEVGEIKYAYDSETNSIQEYVYTSADKGWVAKGGSGNQSYSIIQNGATRYWSNNSYATSCLGYIKSGTNIYTYVGATGDGVYRIDPDGSGTVAPFDVYCDMTTDGGGWTRFLIIGPGTLGLNGVPNTQEFVNQGGFTFSKTLLKNSNKEVLFKEQVSPYREHKQKFDPNINGETFVGILTGDVDSPSYTWNYILNKWDYIPTGTCNNNNHSQFNCTPVNGVRFHYPTRDWSNDGGTNYTSTDWLLNGFVGYQVTTTYSLNNAQNVKNWDNQLNKTIHHGFIR